MFGPGTFINTSVNQIQDQFKKRSPIRRRRATGPRTAARKLAALTGYSKAQQDKIAGEAKTLVANESAKELLSLGLQYKLTGVPQLNDPGFVSTLVFDDYQVARHAEGALRLHLPDAQQRADPGPPAPEPRRRPQRNDAIGLIRAAVAMPKWALPNGKGTLRRHRRAGGRQRPDHVDHQLDRDAAARGPAGDGADARCRLPHAHAAAAAGGRALRRPASRSGSCRWPAASLTMASIAVLPVLVGLAVDYAIQLQARLQESGGDVADAVRRSRVNGAPTVATAAAATAAGFLVLLLSPVPMVRGFGLLLVGGIAVAIACALTLGTSVQALAGRRGPPRRGRARFATGGRWRRGPAGRRRDRLREPRRAAPARAHRQSRSRRAARWRRHGPSACLAIAAVLAVAGWGLDTQTRVESDVQKLVPQNLPALKDLQRAGGVHRRRRRDRRRRPVRGR